MDLDTSFIMVFVKSVRMLTVKIVLGLILALSVMLGTFWKMVNVLIVMKTQNCNVFNVRALKSVLIVPLDLD